MALYLTFDDGPAYSCRWLKMCPTQRPAELEKRLAGAVAGPTVHSYDRTESVTLSRLRWRVMKM